MIALKPLQIAGLTTAALAAVFGFWLLRNFDPNVEGGIFPECMFRAWTGFHCIACGMTRALHALVHGDLVRAFSFNPLIITLLALAPLLAGWNMGWKPGWMRPLVATLAAPRFWLVLLPAYMIARNLPWFPFTLLAPGS